MKVRFARLVSGSKVISDLIVCLDSSSGNTSCGLLVDRLSLPYVTNTFTKHQSAHARLTTDTQHKSNVLMLLSGSSWSQAIIRLHISSWFEAPFVIIIL